MELLISVEAEAIQELSLESFFSAKQCKVSEAALGESEAGS